MSGQSQSQADPSNPDLIYVLGAGRSGTTLLDVVLGSAAGAFSCGEIRKFLQLDGRPAIWSKDRLATYDQRLLRALQQAAAAAGTALQPVVYDSAASDASLVAYAGLAPRIACMGQVRANSHGYEVARLSVFDNMLNTLIAFVETWTGD